MSLLNTDPFQPETNGLSGLVNLKNTCYINSSLQLLSHTYELNQVLNHPDFDHFVKETNDGQLLHEWKNLCQLLWHRDCTIQPNKFINIVFKCSSQKDAPFHHTEEHDVSEFLYFLLDSFHNGLSRSVQLISSVTDNEYCNQYHAVLKDIYTKEYSEINQLFFGGIVSHIVNAETRQILTTNYEQYFQLSLPIPSIANLTLKDCLRCFLEDVHLTHENGNSWLDETTNTRINVIKTTAFCNLPPILVISLKRFSNSFQKNDDAIQIPQHAFNLNSFMEHCNPHEINYTYQLYGVCEHTTFMNAIHFGHYKVYIRIKNKKWFCFNDESVRESSFSEINSRNVYCLFYRRIAK